MLWCVVVVKSGDLENWVYGSQTPLGMGEPSLWWTLAFQQPENPTSQNIFWPFPVKLLGDTIMLGASLSGFIRSGLKSCDVTSYLMEVHQELPAGQVSGPGTPNWVWFPISTWSLRSDIGPIRVLSELSQHHLPHKVPDVGTRREGNCKLLRVSLR